MSCPMPPPPHTFSVSLVIICIGNILLCNFCRQVQEKAEIHFRLYVSVIGRSYKPTHHVTISLAAFWSYLFAIMIPFENQYLCYFIPLQNLDTQIMSPRHCSTFLSVNYRNLSISIKLCVKCVLY